MPAHPIITAESRIPTSASLPRPYAKIRTASYSPNISMKTLRETLDSAVTAALRAANEERKQTLRLVQAAIKQFEVDTRTTITEGEILQIFQKEIKALQETAADAEKANRPSLLAQAHGRMAILQEFLPAQLDREQIIALVETAISTTGALGKRQMGAVMKALLPQVQGRADAKLVSSIVSELLP